MGFAYRPRFSLLIKRGDGGEYTIRNVQSIQATVETGRSVGQMHVVLADTDGSIRRVVRPHAMNLVQLWLQNRHGYAAVAWTGYVDTVQEHYNPAQGNTVELGCTSPVKLFEITSQEPGDVYAVKIAAARNIAGTSILQYAAAAVGYPLSMLRIHPVADAGTGYQAPGLGDFEQPDQQTWAAIVAGVQQNSGVEWFFDAGGYSYWRQNGFVSPWNPYGPQGVRALTADDIISAAYTETDQGIVTTIQVRYWGGGSFVQTAEQAQAPAGMIAGLRKRTQVVYAPWVGSQAYAQYLAQVLLAQYAAGVANATVTIPANSTIDIGSLVSIPALTGDGTSVYYVAGIGHHLDWGGQWVTQLDLSYGRTPRASFPYLGAVSYPVITSGVAAALPKDLAIAPVGNGPVSEQYTLFAQRGLKKGQIALAPGEGLVAPGSEVWLFSKPNGKGTLYDKYTAVAGASTQVAGTFGLLTPPARTGWIVVTTSPSVGSGPAAGPTPNTVVFPPGTAIPANSDPRFPVIAHPTNRGQKALIQAITLHAQPYLAGYAGETY